MDQKKNSLFYIKQQFAHCWFALVRQEREWKMDRDRGFSSFYVTNKEINKSLPALTGGGKAGHLSLSIYEVVASTPALRLPLKYLNVCVWGENRSAGLQWERSGEVLDTQACWTACGFFPPGLPNTHYTLHTLVPPWVVLRSLKGVERIAVILRSVFDPREEKKNHTVKNVKLNSWRNVWSSLTNASLGEKTELVATESVNKGNFFFL